MKIVFLGVLTMWMLFALACAMATSVPTATPAPTPTSAQLRELMVAGYLCLQNDSEMMDLLASMFASEIDHAMDEWADELKTEGRSIRLPEMVDGKDLAEMINRDENTFASFWVMVASEVGVRSEMAEWADLLCDME